jgi:hypothetical protein
MTELSELFYSNLVIGFSGLILALGALFYRSKCDKVSICCGLIRIHRNIESEIENDRTHELPDTHIPDLENNTRHD